MAHRKIFSIGCFFLLFVVFCQAEPFSIIDPHELVSANTAQTWHKTFGDISSASATRIHPLLLTIEILPTQSSFSFAHDHKSLYSAADDALQKANTQTDFEAALHRVYVMVDLNSRKIGVASSHYEIAAECLKYKVRDILRSEGKTKDLIERLHLLIKNLPELMESRVCKRARLFPRSVPLWMEGCFMFLAIVSLFLGAVWVCDRLDSSCLCDRHKVAHHKKTDGDKTQPEPVDSSYDYSPDSCGGSCGGWSGSD